MDTRFVRLSTDGFSFCPLLRHASSSTQTQSARLPLARLLLGAPSPAPPTRPPPPRRPLLRPPPPRRRRASASPSPASSSTHASSSAPPRATRPPRRALALDESSRRAPTQSARLHPPRRILLGAPSQIRVQILLDESSTQSQPNKFLQRSAVLSILTLMVNKCIQVLRDI